MNESTLFLFCAVISGPLGIVVGYVLNEWGTRRREARAVLIQRNNVRMLLRLENDYNLKALCEVWETVTKLPTSGSGLGFSAEEEAFVYRHQLATWVIQPWAHLMWHSCAQSLAGALSPKEIQRTYALHMMADMFDSLRGKLAAQFDQDEFRTLWQEYARWKERENSKALLGQGSFTSFQYAPNLEFFNQRTLQLWRGCEDFYKVARQQGNPIKEDEAHPRLLMRGVRWVVRLPKPKISWAKSAQE